MRAVRAMLVVAGVVCGLVGLWQLREESLEQIVSVGLWLAGGVIVHDALLAPLTVAVVVGVARFVPRRSRGTVVVGFVGWATITVASLNVLLGVGGKPDNPTLVDRPYLTSWLVLTVVWWIGVGVVAARRPAVAAPAGDPAS